MWITESPVENAVQMEVANWRKGVANWRKGVANWRKGEKQLHSRTQCTFASFVTEKVWLHVWTIPIMCTFLHFLWKIFPQSAIEEKFPCFRPFVLPTLYTRGAGNLTTIALPSYINWLSSFQVFKHLKHEHLCKAAKICKAWKEVGSEFWLIKLVEIVSLIGGIISLFSLEWHCC